MAVVVVLDIDDVVREQQSLTIEVRSDDDRVAAAMAVLRPALLALRAPGADGEPVGAAFVSSPIPVPGAYLLVIDFGPLPAEQILAVPELLAGHLRGAGVRDAVVSVARHDPIDAIEEYGPSARAYLRGPLGPPFTDTPGPRPGAIPSPRPGGGVARPSAPAPLPLLDVALDWWHAERRPGDETSVIVLGVRVPVTAETARPVAAAVLSTLPTATTLTLLAGDLTDRLVAATVGSEFHNAVPAASLTAAPPHGDPAGLVERMRRLRDLLRRHAGALVWAGVDIEPDNRRVLLPQWSQRTPADGTRVTRRPGVELLADELVPDAMWYQVLSAGHLDRLGGLPSGAVPLPGGRAELTVGEPEQWLPGHPDAHAVRDRARDLLTGCLVDEKQAFALSTARMRRALGQDD
ncbi:hypothetical protein AB0J20_15305 [Micromonospora costi]|uniref:hypothetical protein n=1 Tax=Micromonospora costi TaxID=1530042 RepID=UPI0033FEB880